MGSWDRKDGACKSIYQIPEHKKYVKYGKYAQYVQNSRYLPACHQSRHTNNVERHPQNVKDSKDAQYVEYGNSMG
jgi:hypothetical protein